MPRVRVNNISISVDGYAAGPGQSLHTPLGVGGERLHDWFFHTRSWHQMQGTDGGDEGQDNEMIVRGILGIGATIMGRNMFGPIRGPWGDDRWSGWWGEEPPYHQPVFVLTNYPHEPISMQGGTVFTFVTEGIHVALEQAFDAAGGQDVKIAGGASTIQQYLRAGLVDELHMAIAPRLLGSGEHLLYGVDLTTLGYECSTHVPTAAATHVVLTRRQ